MFELLRGSLDIQEFGSGAGLLFTAVLLGPVALNLVLNLIRFRARPGCAAGAQRPPVSILIPAGRHLPSRHMAAVNGQCWMIDGGLYERHLPHLKVRSEVLEDVMIGRYMYVQGVRPRLVNVQGEVAVHMYESFREAWLGFRKNVYAMIQPSPQ